MKASRHSSIGRLLRAAAAAALALTICLGIVGCLNVDVAARGYRKYWEPYVPKGTSQDANSSAAEAARPYPGYGMTVRQEAGH